MSGSSRTITGFQRARIHEEGKEGALWKQIIQGTGGQLVKNGFPSARKSFSKDLVDLKGLYPAAFMNAMGFGNEVSSATSEVIDDTIIKSYLESTNGYTISGFNSLEKGMPSLLTIGLSHISATYPSFYYEDKLSYTGYFDGSLPNTKLYYGFTTDAGLGHYDITSYLNEVETTNRFVVVENLLNPIVNSTSYNRNSGTATANITHDKKWYIEALESIQGTSGSFQLRFHSYTESTPGGPGEPPIETIVYVIVPLDSPDGFIVTFTFAVDAAQSSYSNGVYNIGVYSANGYSDTNNPYSDWISYGTLTAMGVTAVKPNAAQGIANYFQVPLNAVWNGSTINFDSIEEGYVEIFTDISMPIVVEQFINTAVGSSLSGIVSSISATYVNYRMNMRVSIAGAYGYFVEFTDDTTTSNPNQVIIPIDTHAEVTHNIGTNTMIVNNVSMSYQGTTLSVTQYLLSMNRTIIPGVMTVYFSGTSVDSEGAEYIIPLDPYGVISNIIYGKANNSLLNGSSFISYIVDTNIGTKIGYIPMEDIPGEFTKTRSIEILPHIPVKKDGVILEDSKLDVVMGKIGLETSVFTETLGAKEINSAYIDFAIPLTGTSQEELAYCYETLAYMYENTGIDSVGDRKVTYSKKHSGMLYQLDTTIRKRVIVGVLDNQYNRIKTKYALYVTKVDDEGYAYDELIKNVSYSKQTSPTEYTEYTAIGGRALHIINGRTKDATMQEYLPGGELFVLPMIKEVMAAMPFKVHCHLIEVGMHLLVYTVVVVKTKWYQTGLFKFALMSLALFTGQYWAFVLIMASDGILKLLNMLGIEGVWATLIITAIAIASGDWSQLGNNIMVTAQALVMAVSTVTTIYAQMTMGKLQKAAEAMDNELADREAESEELQDSVSNPIYTQYNEFGPDDFYAIALGDIQYEYDMLYNYDVVFTRDMPQ